MNVYNKWDRDKMGDAASKICAVEMALIGMMDNGLSDKAMNGAITILREVCIFMETGGKPLGAVKAGAEGQGHENHDQE